LILRKERGEVMDSMREMDAFTGQHLLVAALELNSGMSTEDIAALLGKDNNWVYEIRKHPLYKQRMDILRDVVSRNSKDNKKLFDDYLNKQVLPSLKTLVELRDGSYKDSVRLKAAEAVLDRATSAPRKDTGEGGARVLIQIGTSQLGEIKGVLQELGAEKVVDLLEDATGAWSGAPGEGGDKGRVRRQLESEIDILPTRID
jgi:hypothetical protein